MRPGIIFRSTAPAPFQPEQHAADKGVNCGFAGLILAVYDIQTVCKGHITVVEFTESIDV